MVHLTDRLRTNYKDNGLKNGWKRITLPRCARVAAVFWELKYSSITREVFSFTSANIEIEGSWIRNDTQQSGMVTLDQHSFSICKDTVTVWNTYLWCGEHHLTCQQLASWQYPTSQSEDRHAPRENLTWKLSYINVAYIILILIGTIFKY
jgi:hypothetical protein